MRFQALSIACAAALGLSAAACGGDKDVPFTIRFVLATDVFHGCSSTDCADFGMSCGAILGVRIVDAESVGSADAGAEPATPKVLGTSCILVPASETLCGVDDVVGDIEFDNVPTRMVQIQVAMWRPDMLDDPTECPTDIFDLQGIPLLIEPQPAFGGAAFFHVGSQPVAEVKLACREPAQLNALQCLPETNKVTARLTDMNTVVSVRVEDAPFLDVSVGEPQLDTTQDPPVWVIGPSEAHELNFLDPGPIPPVWTRDDIPVFKQTACVLASEDVARPTTSVICTNDAAADENGLLNLDGLVLPEDILEKILTARGISGFPEAGLVIGRVVDDVRQPLGDVSVSVEGDNATVLYVNENFTGTDATGPTASHGYFLSENAAYGSIWRAAHKSDGRIEDTAEGDFVAGLIQGKASVLVIKMTELP